MSRFSWATDFAGRFARKLLPRGPIEVVEELLNSIDDFNSEQIKVLDIGFGYGGHWNSDPRERHRHLTITSVDAVSAEKNNLLFQPDHSILATAPGGLSDFPDESFDVVIAFDIIEHLPLHLGYELVYQIQRITKTYAVIFTPNGFVWQPPFPGNPFQAHVSGWTPKDFKSLGFSKIRGVRGLKWIYGPMSRSKFGPESNHLSGLVAPVDRVACNFPELCFSFVAVYEVGVSQIFSLPQVAKHRTG